MAEYIEREAALRNWPSCEEPADAYQFVRDFPAANVRPVVRGKWIADGDGYQWTYNCSICGWKDGYPFNERHSYCPNCGADMRQEPT